MSFNFGCMPSCTSECNCPKRKMDKSCQKSRGREFQETEEEKEKKEKRTIKIGKESC